MPSTQTNVKCVHRKKRNASYLKDYEACGKLNCNYLGRRYDNSVHSDCVPFVRKVQNNMHQVERKNKFTNDECIHHHNFFVVVVVIVVAVSI